LSDSTTRQVYTILRAALDGAVRDGLMGRNPAALVKHPGIERREAKHLDDADVTAVLRAIKAVACSGTAASRLPGLTGFEPATT
jgi:integrase